MTFRDLIAWQKGIDFVVVIYDYTSRLPQSEKYGLVPQMQRAVVSIPSNLAEGHGRSSKGDFARFVDIALGSVRELQTQLVICERLGYPSATNELELAEELAKITFKLAKSLRSGS